MVGTGLTIVNRRIRQREMMNGNGKGSKNPKNDIPVPVRVVIYTRISKDRETETSMGNQLTDCEKFCEKYEIVGRFGDRGKSAFKLDVERPEFEKALGMIESGQANRLVVWKLDRMTRNARGFMKINDRLEAMGATFQSVQEPWFDTSSPIGLALVQLMAALAQIEAEGIQGRMLSWHEGRRRDGKVPVGPRPYGYRRPKEHDDDWVKGGSLHVVPEEEAIINEVAQRVLIGDGLRTIARDLTNRGVPTPKGIGPWNHVSIKQFLTRPTTAGLHTDLSPAESWKAILEIDTWERLGEVLNDPDRARFNGGGHGKTIHLLPRLMSCGKCGGDMVTEIHSKGRQYACEDCGMSIMASIPEAKIDNWIRTNVSDSQWQSLLTQGRGHDPEVLEEIQARIDDTFIDRATNPKRVSREVYEHTMAILEAQKEAAQTEPAVKIPMVDDLQAEWPTMSNDDKRLVIAATIGRITVEANGKGCTGENRVRIGEPELVN